MYHEGTIGLQNNILAHFWVKAFDEGSEYGINGGRISKLTITINGHIVANYDRGWDVKPNDENAITAYNIILKQYN